MNRFSAFGLSEHTLISLDSAGFETPTEVQEKTIGLILEGADVIATAQTGTGKTGAFAIPIIENLSKQQKRKTASALVLVPTRELALQVKSQFDLLGKKARIRCTTIYGGMTYSMQISSLRKGIDVIAATPGRLIDLINQGLVDLSTIQYIVLDEADRMLDMGFRPQVESILSALTASRQTLMFTATLDDRICKLGNLYMNSPQIVRCRALTVVPTLITQRIHCVKEAGKEELLMNVLNEFNDASILVFTKTRRKAGQVAKSLRNSDIHAEEIHGDISQNKREKTLKRFRTGAFRVLVATDVAARGLDVPDISHVVNYDIPQTPEEYIHRIGRTGRAGKEGTAHTFISNSEVHFIRNVEKLIGHKLLSKDMLPKAEEKSFGRKERSSFGAKRTSTFRKAESSSSDSAPKLDKPSYSADKKSADSFRKPKAFGHSTSSFKKYSDSDASDDKPFARRTRTSEGFGDKPFAKRTRTSEGFGDKPFAKRSRSSEGFGSKPFGKRAEISEGSDSKPFGKRTRSSEGFGSKPFAKRTRSSEGFGSKPFGKRSETSEGSDSKPFGKRSETSEGSDSKPFGKRTRSSEGFGSKPFGKRTRTSEGFGSKPFGKRTRTSEGFGSKPFGKRSETSEGSDSKPFGKRTRTSEGFGSKPFGKRTRSSEGAGSKPFAKRTRTSGGSSTGTSFKKAGTAGTAHSRFQKKRKMAGRARTR